MAPTRGIQPWYPLSDSMSISRVIMRWEERSLQSSGMRRLKTLKKATGEGNLMVVTAS